jgi:K+-sensing histidine kinase KdpD
VLVSKKNIIYVAELNDNFLNQVRLLSAILFFYPGHFKTTIQLENFQADIEAVNRIAIVPSLLDVVCRITGMGFAAIARVTEDRWIACSVKDDIAFGLKPGGELKVETTICNEIRSNHEAVIIDHVDADPNYCNHHTPAMYGFQSYISMPIFKKEDGSFFGTLCAIDPKPARLNNPEIIGMFRLFADLISFHLHTVEDLVSIKGKLHEEQKTGELREQFIAILGHDLRNPVGAISNSAQLLERLPVEDNVKNLAAVIRRSSHRVLGLIENILDFARGRMGSGIVLNVKAVNLANVLNEVIDELQSIWPGRTIETQFDLSTPVTCDSDRIAQLFSNLLSNALSYGKPDTPVKVLAKNHDGVFTLSVTNAGPEIPGTAMKHLFTAFSRSEAKAGQQGLGLGLYIAAEIARAHGGKINVVSAQNETSFTLTIPS